MTAKFMKKASLAVLVGAASLAVAGPSAEAGTVQLGNSGWSASWDASWDPYVGVNVDFQSSDTVFIEKFVNYTSAQLNAGFINGVDIVFQQTSANAVQFIVLNDEQLVNNTGVSWIGFQMLVDPVFGGGVKFDTGKTDISPPGSGFSIDPFTQHTWSNGDATLDVSGGVIPSGPPVPGPGTSNVWFPGARSGGLAIIANPSQVGTAAFRLKETPIIPLPMAAWSGLSGLAGLALLAAGKRIRRVLA
jgi:hypothetical protein